MEPLYLTNFHAQRCRLPFGSAWILRTWNLTLSSALRRALRFEVVGEPGEDEMDMLDLTTDVKDTSRLGCQATAEQRAWL